VVCGEGLIHIPERVIELFPNDPDLKPLNAVSYMGLRITDREGTVLGHLAVLDTKPLPEEVQTQALFRVFAARAGAELLRLRAEAEVHAREQQLRRLIDGAMDGIVEFDTLGRVTMMNLSAAGFFGCKATDVIGAPLARFFVDASTRTLSTLMERLSGSDDTGSSSWIPSGLVAKTCAGREFPAEATLSRSDVKGQPFYTLILRNVDDRQDAEMRIAALLSETNALRATGLDRPGPDRANRCDGAGHRRDRNREGAGRTRHPYGQPKERWPVRASQLRRNSSHPDRERTIRT
jgi:PAS domain S-box-containing protein